MKQVGLFLVLTVFLSITLANEISAVTCQPAPTSYTCQAPPISKVRLDTTEKYLCYGTNVARFSGYESFLTSTLNSFYDASYPEIADFFNTIQFTNVAGTNASHGGNMQRFLTFGNYNINFSGQQLMPFWTVTDANGVTRYNIQHCVDNTDCIKTGYATRLRNAMAAANASGVVLIVNLFSGDGHLGNSANYKDSPWHPGSQAGDNNMNCPAVDGTPNLPDQYAFPNLYQSVRANIPPRPIATLI